jgi:Tfp pilus assembly protein PilP
VDPPEYFQEGHLMAYSNEVQEYIAALEAKASTPMSALFKHFHAMSYQIAALRDAFAIARTLNRTLVRTTAYALRALSQPSLARPCMRTHPCKQ